MYRSSLFLSAVLIGTTVAFIQPVAAKSAAEVEAIARSVTVEIKLTKSRGSGVIIHRKGDLYTLVTNQHVVCGGKKCSELPQGENYNLKLPDSTGSPKSQQHQVKKSNIKLLGDDLDLAIIQFRSNRNYSVAKIAAAGSLKTKNDVYTAGFPAEQSSFSFGKGEVIAVVNKRLIGDDGGYTIIYDAPTLPGMSGGGILDSNGQLVAIHGQGDRFKENTEFDTQSRLNSKMGINRGIPVLWLIQSLQGLGINLRGSSVGETKITDQQGLTTADEYFIAGFNKFVKPGSDVLAGKRKAIQEFSKAIQIDPRYQYAYFMRALTYEQIKDFKRSLSDYNQVILINPKASQTYNNRANLKRNRLNDFHGALTDYDQAIIISPDYPITYYNRGLLKVENLNDLQGSLSDFNQAIKINPKFAEAYNGRAILKSEKLNDVRGALSDFNQAIKINPKFSNAYYNRGFLKYNKLNNIKEALADYDQAIIHDSKHHEAYNSRAILKEENLKDYPGALADYNQAIKINPKFSNAYYNRGLLKDDRLKDKTGAIQDFRQAAKLYREEGKTEQLQKAIYALKKLGATE
jgi:tetratricopeptide (TPR) repeat protein